MRSSAKGYVKTYGIGLIPFIGSWANQMIDGASNRIEKAVLPSCLPSTMEWLENNGLDDNNVFVRIDEVCACLGRDIIDRLGYSQSFGERN